MALASERLKRYVRVAETGCWEHGGYVLPNGYGTVCVQGRSYRAHRLAYELWCGPIPAGKLVLHNCDNRKCINPAHLRVGTAKENSMDVVLKGYHPNASKTHCARGHAYAEHGRVMHNGWRRCVACERTRNQRPSVKRGKGPWTHCRRGHELAGANLYVDPSGKHRCRACHMIRTRLDLERRAAATTGAGP